MAQRKTGPGQFEKRTPASLKVKLDLLLFNFDFDDMADGTLKPEHRAALVSQVVPLLLGNNDQVKLHGFASQVGQQDYNFRLSAHRIDKVAAVLLANGVKEAQIVRRPHGEERSTSSNADDPKDRAVGVMVFVGTVPPGPTPPGPTPPSPGGLSFTADLFGWIPQPEVDNPLQFLPGPIKGLLPAGMADPFFGGDDFIVPTLTPAGLAGRTFRATQQLAFNVARFGDAPSGIIRNVTPGVTTCLSGRRSAGGKVTFRLKATLRSHSEAVSFDASNDWYEVTLSGMVLDPVPAAAAAAIVSKVPLLAPPLRAVAVAVARELTTKATPSLTWSVSLRIMRGSVIPRLTRLKYKAFNGAELSGTLSGAGDLRLGDNLIHGTVHFSLWPSAVLHLTLKDGGAPAVVQPVFFASGAGAIRPETTQILIPKFCKVRQVRW